MAKSESSIFSSAFLLVDVYSSILSFYVGENFVSYILQRQHFGLFSDRFRVNKNLLTYTFVVAIVVLTLFITTSKSAILSNFIFFLAPFILSPPNKKIVPILLKILSLFLALVFIVFAYVA